MPQHRSIVACLSLLLLAACGTETYETRLRETNEFFEYHQRLNLDLQSGDWTSPTTVKMRVPQGLQLLPAPPPAQMGEPPAVDQRQPFYLGVELPGLIGAWQGEFPCDNGNRPVYLYVCSNHQAFQNLLVNAQGPDPGLFLSDLENALSAQLGVQLPPGESAQVGNNQRYSLSCPREGTLEAKFAVPRRFTGITFIPPHVLNNIGVEIKAQMYEHYNGPIQVAILAVYPASIRDRFEEKLLRALETFSVSNTVPKSQPGASSSGNSNGPPAGF